MLDILKDLPSLALFVATLIVSGVIVTAAIYFTKWLKFGQLEKWAGLIVNSIEQTAKLMPPERKKEMAVIAMRAVASRIGAKVSDEEIEMMLEANVHLMKNIVLATEGNLDDRLIEALTGGIVED